MSNEPRPDIPEPWPTPLEDLENRADPGPDSGATVFDLRDSAGSGGVHFRRTAEEQSPAPAGFERLLEEVDSVAELLERIDAALDKRSTERG